MNRYNLTDADKAHLWHNAVWTRAYPAVKELKRKYLPPVGEGGVMAILLPASWLMIVLMILGVWKLCEIIF